MGRSRGDVLALFLSAVPVALLAAGRRVPLPRVLLWPAAGLGAAVVANQLSGKPVPFLRWSFLRLMLGLPKLVRDWQVGDGREEAAAAYVEQHARPGDLDDAIRTFDRFCRERSMMINVGDEKGKLLDAAVRRTRPRRVLELGTYCGYSALRIAREMPADAHLYSVDMSAANAAIARRVLAHAGVADRVTVVVGTLGDGGVTVGSLRERHGFTQGSVDLVFVDHAKDAYLPDLLRIIGEGWLHVGSVVVGDNIRFPGAPDFRAYLREQEGRTFRTVEHDTHLEYQSVLADIVTESEYLGAGG